MQRRIVNYQGVTVFSSVQTAGWRYKISYGRPPSSANTVATSTHIHSRASPTTQPALSFTTHSASTAMFAKLTIFVSLLATFVAATPVSTSTPVVTAAPIMSVVPVSTAAPVFPVAPVPLAPAPLQCTQGSPQCCQSIKHVTPANTTTEPGSTLFGVFEGDILPQAGINCNIFDGLAALLGSPAWRAVFFSMCTVLRLTRVRPHSEAQLGCCVTGSIIEGMGARRPLFLAVALVLTTLGLIYRRRRPRHSRHPVYSVCPGTEDQPLRSGAA